MMKKIYLSVLLALFFVGCGGSVDNTAAVIINDDTVNPISMNNASNETEVTVAEKIYLDAINTARTQDQVCGNTPMSKATALIWNPKLALAAEDHAKDISANNYREQDDLSVLMTDVDDGTIREVTSINRYGIEHETFHVGSGTSTDVALQTYPQYTESTFVERIKHREYTGFQTAGENITTGTNRDTAEKAVQAWISSPGHCLNLMNPDFKEVGMGHVKKDGTFYTHYWVQEFGG